MSSPDLGATLPVASERHRITYATSRTLAYVSVLELGKVWERTLRRGGVPVKYSLGYNPRPRMHFAAPLPVGCGCERDLLDLTLETAWTSTSLLDSIQGVTPRDLSAREVVSVALSDPALPELLEAAEYAVWLREVAASELLDAVAGFLAETEVLLPRRGRKHHGKLYNLRPLVLSLVVDASPPPPWQGLRFRVKARPGATGRPDEVLRALGLSSQPRRCTRTRLFLDESQPQHAGTSQAEADTADDAQRCPG